MSSNARCRESGEAGLRRPNGQPQHNNLSLGSTLLTIGDLATLQKVELLGYDYVDGWLRPHRSWRWWLLAKLTALLSDGSDG